LVFTQVFTLSTRKKIELLKITEKVSEAVKKSSVREGVILIHTPHTTAGLIINEAEPGLISDLEKTFQKLIPWNESYVHNRVDNNAPSHILASILSPSLSLPLTEGRISLGTWQSIFFVELDGPRTRRVEVKIVGE
jgi:secondary thiamine-phosphate synthase enzyme